MREVFVIGAGMTRFKKYFQTKRIEDLGREACVSALKHAGVNQRQIEAVYSGNVMDFPNVGQRICDQIGISGVPVFNHENACGSSAAAFRDAYFAVANGAFELVMCVGAESMTGKMAGIIDIGEGKDLQNDAGLVMPAVFALLARRHMEEYGTTPEQFARISVKNHQHGALNPYAQYQREVTLEEVLNSRLICDPITLLECTPIGDGAAAVILCSDKVARKYTTKPVKILASVLISGKYKGNKGNATRINACCEAAQLAYETAGVGPEDLDVIELHDCFAPHELLAYEDLGLCAKGEGGRMVDEGRTSLGGDIPVNPSGGLLSKGHPLGATGVAQVVEIVWQLRGEAGKRQVKGAKIGLAHNGGGIGPGLEPGAMSIIILGS